MFGSGLRRSSELSKSGRLCGMPQLTYRQTVPNAFCVSADGVEIGSISLQPRHVHPMSTYWHLRGERTELLVLRCMGLEMATLETCRLHQAMSEFEGKAEDICSH